MPVGDASDGRDGFAAEVLTRERGPDEILRPPRSAPVSGSLALKLGRHGQGDQGCPRRGPQAGVSDRVVSASIVTLDDMEVVLRTRTPEGVEVILSALVYAKILEEHSAAIIVTVFSTERSPA